MFNAVILFSNNYPKSVLVLTLLNLILFFIFILPEVIKYLRLVKLSKNIIIEINQKEKIVRIQNNYMMKSYAFDNIKSISRVSTERAGRRKEQKPRRGDFYYFVIEFKTKEEIIITSLMTDEKFLEINGKENNIDSQGNGWISIEGRNIVNLQKNWKNPVKKEL